MANVTKINLDGTAYDAGNNAPKLRKIVTKINLDGEEFYISDIRTQANANTIAAKAVTVKYNSEETSLVVTTGIALS